MNDNASTDNQDPPGKYFEEPYKSAAGTIWDGNTYFFKKIFAQENLQVTHIGKGNWSLLLYSIACQNHEAMQFLLDKGADPNLVNPDSVQIGRETVPYPIQAVAYAANEDTKFLKTLLEAGGDPNSKYSTTQPCNRRNSSTGPIEEPAKKTWLYYCNTELI